MKEEKESLFLKSLSANLDLPEDSLTLNTKLEEIDFDSLAILSTIATIDEVFGTTIDPQSLINCKNFKEIFNLLN